MKMQKNDHPALGIEAIAEPRGRVQDGCHLMPQLQQLPTALLLAVLQSWQDQQPAEKGLQVQEVEERHQNPEPEAEPPPALQHRGICEQAPFNCMHKADAREACDEPFQRSM